MPRQIERRASTPGHALISHPHAPGRSPRQPLRAPVLPSIRCEGHEGTCATLPDASAATQRQGQPCEHERHEREAVTFSTMIRRGHLRSAAGRGRHLQQKKRAANVRLGVSSAILGAR